MIETNEAVQEACVAQQEQLADEAVILACYHESDTIYKELDALSAKTKERNRRFYKKYIGVYWAAVVAWVACGLLIFFREFLNLREAGREFTLSDIVQVGILFSLWCSPILLMRYTRLIGNVLLGIFFWTFIASGAELSFSVSIIVFILSQLAFIVFWGERHLWPHYERIVYNDIESDYERRKQLEQQLKICFGRQRAARRRLEKQK